MLCGLGNDFPDKEIPWRLEMAVTLVRCKGSFTLADFLDREDGPAWYDAAWVASRALHSAEVFKQSEANAQLKQQQQRR